MSLDPVVRAAMFDVDVDRPNHLLGLTFAETMVRAMHERSIQERSRRHEIDQVVRGFGESSLEESQSMPRSMLPR